MARKKKESEGSSTPAWLITFSDLMTLLLTFFVLLLSMAVIDERSKLEVLGSVSRQFGMGNTIINPTAPLAPPTLNEPGVMDNTEDLEPLRDRIFDDSSRDLNFQENKYVQIFSINDEVLFTPGRTELSNNGIMLLDRLLPYLQEIQYPLLVAGHTSIRRDEEGLSYLVALASKNADSTWLLSYRRAASVYRHLAMRGISPNRLSLEAFGQYHPRFTNNTPEGRKKNRRVDLVLDKRNQDWIKKVEALQRKSEAAPTNHYYKGFKFDLTMPGTPIMPARRGH